MKRKFNLFDEAELDLPDDAESTGFDLGIGSGREVACGRDIQVSK